jgi:hypothetical protein
MGGKCKVEDSWSQAKLVRCASSKKSIVLGHFQYLLLKANQSVFAFPVQKRHMDLKHSEEAIGSILDPASLSGGSPGQPFSNVAYSWILPVKNTDVDTSNDGK